MNNGAPEQVTTEGRNGFWATTGAVALTTAGTMAIAAGTAFAAGVGYVGAYAIGKLFGVFPKNS